ncbi:deoxyuridine 5'-triphosphate nucleotidohydrolase [Chrysochromulina ericina virus CeV-01B]|uniref:Deoxyuridine 5'-triphosphate nucleotidohydrolase n=1 Tax=Chrysochromulina ericina virus CeV-01B TaxID=3070830 RepID=A0A0N9R4A9_9VIRU|nr:deoxyuridine 5'-triphosphate nucleotidohydrolase [Chrysochromulina ericina virus]ALH23363.1 deoxyuridine 5'-triphosphate nucleotidohydrolase [Chrysochromulina ericina virus CeV-01B]
MERMQNLGYLFPDNYYILNIFLTNSVPKTIVKKYKSIMNENNSIFEYGSNKYIVDHPYIDAGTDLYCISNLNIENGSLSNKIDLGVKCSMVFVSTNSITKQTIRTPSGYYLYPRSSTGSKTPLRLSNQVGIMDSGYRGNVIACFDNVDHKNQFNDSQYDVIIGHRLVQICAPNITYPTVLNIVSSDAELDIPQTNNQRGTGGFGSSGY